MEWSTRFELATFSLGGMYKDGEGVTKDHTLAYMWWVIAASQGHSSAKLNLTFSTDMTTAEILRARDLARECVAKNYKDC